MQGGRKKVADDQKILLFEKLPIPKAVMQLSVPTVLSSLVMVIYNLADTYFVGMMNDPVQNAAVTLAAPVLLAFNAVNNLFGVGSSSMMSRALGSRDYDKVGRSSAFGFYCSLIAGLLFSFLCFSFRGPLLRVLGADPSTVAATLEYLRWTVMSERCNGLYGAGGGGIPACQYRNDERMSFKYYSGSCFYSAMGA